MIAAGFFDLFDGTGIAVGCGIPSPAPVVIGTMLIAPERKRKPRLRRCTEPEDLAFLGIMDEAWAAEEAWVCYGLELEEAAP